MNEKDQMNKDNESYISYIKMILDIHDNLPTEIRKKDVLISLFGGGSLGEKYDLGHPRKAKDRISKLMEKNKRR